MPSPPQITSIYPSQGTKYGYTTITLTGTNFTIVNEIKFILTETENENETETIISAENFTILSDTSITVVSPPPPDIITYDVSAKIVLYYDTYNTIDDTSLFVYTTFPIYVGLQYVLTAIGGFSIKEKFSTIEITNYPVHKKNVTNVLQVSFDVRKINSVLGIIKDANNIQILQTIFDPVTQTFPDDEITLNSTEFVNGLTISNIISVGKLSTLYLNFTKAVNDYFSYGMFTPLIPTLDYTGIFGPEQFISIITPIEDDGNLINTINGTVELTDINELLNSLVSQNVYNNRGGITVQDGFIDGDLIYVQTGMSITLDLQSFDAPPPQLDIDMTNIDCIVCEKYSNTYSNSDYNKPSITMQGNSIISQNISSPLLIRLSNLTTDPYQYDPDKRPTLP